jgi:RNA polymerase sigma-70 factor (ECF subfamily)
MVAAAVLPDLAFALTCPAEERSLGPSLSGEAAWTRSAARGDRQAFSRLVDLHKRTVFALCIRLLRDQDEAQDAAQEAFARAYASLAAFDASQPFAPWLLRIARNHCLDVLRRRLPLAQRVELDADPEDGAPRDLADPDAPRGDDALERRELARTLEAAVAALPPNYREVVHLFHVEHLSYKEIAAAMDVPIGTVMTWLHRARARLKATLDASAPETTP